MKLDDLAKVSWVIRILLTSVCLNYWTQGLLTKSIKYLGVEINIELARGTMVIVFIFILLTVLALDIWGRMLKLEEMEIDNSNTITDNDIKIGWKPASKKDEKRVKNYIKQDIVTKLTFFIFYIAPIILGISCFIHFIYVSFIQKV